MRVPSPGALSILSLPSSAWIRSTSPRSPDPLCRIGATDAVVFDVDDHDRVPLRDAHPDNGCLGVLGDVRERL